MAHLNAYLANQRNSLIHSLSTTIHLKAGGHLTIPATSCHY